ncbi:hypothetical protein ACFLZY_01520 [Patescibacteria group bacterium]
MAKIIVSASNLKEQIETKAYAYGVSSAVATLLGEFVVNLLRQASQQPTPPLHNSTTP